MIFNQFDCAYVNAGNMEQLLSPVAFVYAAMSMLQANSENIEFPRQFLSIIIILSDFFRNLKRLFIYYLGYSLLIYLLESYLGCMSLLRRSCQQLR